MYRATQSQVEALMNYQAIEQIGTMEIYGRIMTSDGKEVGGIGALDETAIRLGKIRIKEGRFPEKQNEIAMEEKKLKQLGISYEEGKEVSLAMLEGEKYTYRLCGVIKDYSTKWQKEDFSLASGIVADQGEPKETHLFFYGKKYEELSKMEELEVFKQEHDGSKLVKNKMAYDKESLGMEAALQSGIVTVFLTVVSICIIFYIQLMQFQQRKNSLITLQGIGASKDQLFFILLWENVYVLKYALPFGVICGILLPCIILKMLKFRIAVRCNTIVYSVIITLATFFLSTMLMYISIQKLRVAASFRTGSSISKRKKFPHIRKVKRLTTWKMFRRRRQFSRKQTWIQNGVLVFGAFLIVTSSIVATICLDAYQKTKENKGADYGWWGKKYGILTEDIKKIQEMEGISDIKISLGNKEEDGWDTHRRVSWDGFQNSSYLKERNLIIRDWIDVENMDILEDFNGELGQYYKSCMEGSVDETAFREGKEVILVLPSYVKKEGKIVEILEKELPYVKGSVMENTIHPGDMIHVTGEGSGFAFDKTVKVAGIIRTWKEETPKQQQMAWKAGDLIVSPQFEEYPHEFHLEQEDRLGCYLFAYADSDANTAQLDEKLSNIMEERVNKFTNYREEREITMHMQLSLGLLSVGFVIVVFMICFMVLLNGQQMRMQEERRQNSILKFLGMDAVEFQKMYILEGIMESFCSFIISGIFVLVGYGCYIYFTTAIRTWDGIKHFVIDTFPWAIFGAVEGIYFLLYICMIGGLLKESRKWESS